MSEALAEEALYLRRKAEVWNEDEKNWREREVYIDWKVESLKFD